MHKMGYNAMTAMLRAKIARIVKSRAMAAMVETASKVRAKVRTKARAKTRVNVATIAIFFAVSLSQSSSVSCGNISTLHSFFDSLAIVEICSDNASCSWFGKGEGKGGEGEDEDSEGY